MTEAAITIRQFEGAAFVDVRDAARLLAISERQFRKLVAARRLPAGTTLGRSRRWRVDTLIEAAEKAKA